ncbi:MAG TPA: hypothetical protein VNK49_13850 [Anaerolineales bacterium]|nr:hypothetical protein [Anaerolineales bacterium]
MISPLINTIVIAGFGFFIGIILQITINVMPRKEPYSINFDKGLQDFIDRAKKSAEESREMVRTAGSDLRIGMFAFYGLIALLILVLIYSPLAMNWPVFLLALFAGFLLFEWIFKRAKAGKISSPSTSPTSSPPKTSDRINKG